MFIYRKHPKKVDRKRTTRLKAQLKAKNKRRKARMAGKK